jgi:DNA helicase HerA-like ATPase
MRLPGDTERHCIIGTTGSGKTTFGLWCLAQRNYDQKPWLIVDFKREAMIEKIPRIEEIGVDDKVPRRKGLYVVRPTIDDIDDGAVSELFRRIWEHENIGVFIDEGYMVPPRDRMLRALLTQGRSKRIPMINLSQRPAYVSPWLLSESEFKSVFYLDNPADVERVNAYMPAVDPSKLKDHWSYWYQRPGRELVTLSPCPGEAEILDIFERRRVRRFWV